MRAGWDGSASAPWHPPFDASCPAERGSVMVRHRRPGGCDARGALPACVQRSRFEVPLAIASPEMAGA